MFGRKKKQEKIDPAGTWGETTKDLIARMDHLDGEMVFLMLTNRDRDEGIALVCNDYTYGSPFSRETYKRVVMCYTTSAVKRLGATRSYGKCGDTATTLITVGNTTVALPDNVNDARYIVLACPWRSDGTMAMPTSIEFTRTFPKLSNYGAWVVLDWSITPWADPVPVPPVKKAPAKKAPTLRKPKAVTS